MPNKFESDQFFRIVPPVMLEASLARAYLDFMNKEKGT